MTVRTLKVSDNSSLSEDEVSQIPTLISKLSEKTLRELDSEGIFMMHQALRTSDDLDLDQMVISCSKGLFRTGNLMGFLGVGSERLVIKSRFSNDDEDYFFQYLLDRVLKMPNLIDLKSDIDSDNQVFQFLIFLFPHYLKQAMRKGVYKEYKSYERNGGNLKGTIDIARHIRDNTPFIGNVAFNERQFSYDNGLIQLVRHTIEFISLQPTGKCLLAQVKDEVQMVRESTEPYRAYDRRKIVN